MYFKYPNLILVVTIAFMNIICALLPNFLPVIGVVLALPLVFVLPGYTLTEVLFYRNSLDNIYRYRFIISLGLSLTIDIFSGFILNLFPWGLQALPWALCLSILTLFFSLIAVYQRSRSLTSKLQLAKFSMSQFFIDKIRYVSLGICLMLLIIILILSTRISINSVWRQHPSFTQLWMLSRPSSGKNCIVSLGVKSFETKTVKYRIAMMVNDVEVNTWPSIVLAPEEKWNRNVTITPVSKSSVYVEVMIYRSDTPLTIYRQAHIKLSNGENKDKVKC